MLGSLQPRLRVTSSLARSWRLQLSLGLDLCLVASILLLVVEPWWSIGSLFLGIWLFLLRRRVNVSEAALRAEVETQATAVRQAWISTLPTHVETPEEYAALVRLANLADFVRTPTFAQERKDAAAHPVLARWALVTN